MPNDSKGDRVIAKYNQHADILMESEVGASGARVQEDSPSLLPDLVKPAPESDKYIRLDFTEAKRREYFARKREGEGGENHNVDNEGEPDMASVFKRPRLEDAISRNNPGLARQIVTTLVEQGSQKLAGEDSYQLFNNIPQAFRDQLLLQFNAITELLRHFYGYQLQKENASTKGGSGELSSEHTQRLDRIVKHMETKYEELEAIRKKLPRNSWGNQLAPMLRPLMDQLNFAFEKHDGGASIAGGWS